MTMKPEGDLLLGLQALENLRILVGADGLVFGYGVHQPGIDDDVPYYSVAIKTGVGVFSGSSPCIESCMRIAKAKHKRELERLAALRDAARAEKTAKARTVSHCDGLYLEAASDQ